jgi:protein-disulfide isomerase
MKTNHNYFGVSTAARQFVLSMPFLFAAIIPSGLFADTYTFSLVPASGDISGAPGATIGWGYSITNDSTSDWLLATNLNADSFSYGTPILLFDFPEVAPGATVTELFDPVAMTGLYEDVLNSSAPNGSVDSGDFDLSAAWYNGDPFNGGTFIADAVDIEAPYSATVGTGTSSMPEPSSLLLCALGMAAIVALRLTPRAKRLRGATRPGRALPLLALTTLVLAPSTTRAQEGATVPKSDKPQDVGITRQQADQILNELRAIRQLLQRQTGPALQPQAPPQTGKLRLEGGFSIGSNDAPVTIVEFTDYQCPFCRQFHSTTFDEIRKKYVDTGMVRFVVRDFPLSEMHPDAMRAAEAAHCAGDQGQFLPMHDVLFADPGKLSEAGLIDYAQALKLDVPVFKSCLESETHKTEIQNDAQVASSLQINGTPSFLVGKVAGDEVSGAIIVGAQPLSVFETKIKEAETAP